MDMVQPAILCGTYPPHDDLRDMVAGGSRKCEPGCTCKRHNPTHRVGCICPRCRPREPKVPAVKGFTPRKNANPRACWCGHYDLYHDEFGCRSCESQGKKCEEFRPKTEPPVPASKDYAAQVAKLGFIAHNGDLATCSTCWMPVKLGAAHTLSSVINAKAHVQSYHEKPKETSRPNRAG